MNQSHKKGMICTSRGQLYTPFCTPQIDTKLCLMQKDVTNGHGQHCEPRQRTRSPPIVHRRVVVLLDVPSHHQTALAQADHVEPAGKLGVRLHGLGELVHLRNTTSRRWAREAMRQQQHWPYLGLHRSHERLEPVCHVHGDGVRARIPVWTAQPHKAVTESNPSLPCSMANALCHHGFRQRLHARVGTGVTKAVHEHHGADGRTGGSNEGLCRAKRQLCQANFKLTPHCTHPARHSPALRRAMAESTAMKPTNQHTAQLNGVGTETTTHPTLVPRLGRGTFRCRIRHGVRR